MPHLTPENHAEIERLWRAVPKKGWLLSREPTLLAKFGEALRADTLAAVLFEILREADTADELGVGIKDMLTVTVYDLAKRSQR